MSGPPVVWQDTSNFMSIERDHIVELAGSLFLIRGNEHEGRFGLDDQPKFWVKRALAARGKSRPVALSISRIICKKILQYGRTGIKC
jgi:hypothetical protein